MTNDNNICERQMPVRNVIGTSSAETSFSEIRDIVHFFKTTGVELTSIREGKSLNLDSLKKIGNDNIFKKELVRALHILGHSQVTKMEPAATTPIINVEKNNPESIMYGVKAFQIGQGMFVGQNAAEILPKLNDIKIDKETIEKLIKALNEKIPDMKCQW